MLEEGEVPRRRARSRALSADATGSHPIHVVIWLPSKFYSAMAATLVEILQLVNDVRRRRTFSYEFVASASPALSTSGISFRANTIPSRKINVLVMLAVPGLDVEDMIKALDAESEAALRMIALARRDRAIIAAHCGGCYLLAKSGLLDGKRATVSWWLKAAVARRFPRVRWEPSRLLIRQGTIYTCGGGFSGLELAAALLVDLGFANEERIVRKLLLLPPSRKFQSPYEIPLDALSETRAFERKISELARKDLQNLDVTSLAQALSVSQRTLARRFLDELQTSPGRWIQERRLAAARALLEGTKLSVSEVCHRIGYEDVASFSRLFSKATGMAPGEFRRQARS